MVNVTERAKDRLKELLTTKSDDPSVGLRLEQTRSGEFGVLPDHGRANDQVVEHQGGPDPRLVMLRMS